MEAYKEEYKPSAPDGKVYSLYTKANSWISTFLGTILLFAGVAVVFVVSSLEGTKEIKASNTLSGKLLNEWRSENETDSFPEGKSAIVEYNGREYYFVISDVDSETGEVKDWHFAYDGGIEFVFSDSKYYIMTGFTIIVSLYVSYVNYKSTVKYVMGTEKFVKTLNHYQKKKTEIEPYTEFIPDFCIYKNNQMYEMVKRDIVESADITYERYTSPNFNVKALEKWQRKKLKNIKKIKIKKLRSSDLLQETSGNISMKRASLLPASESEQQTKFLVKNAITKALSIGMSGLTFGFGIVLGNWVLGITYASMVFTSYISSVISATDDVNNKFRNRYIAKADYLNEFNNIKSRFIKKKQYELTIYKEDNTKVKQNIV